MNNNHHLRTQQAMTLAFSNGEDDQWFDYRTIPIASNGQIRLVEILPAFEGPVQCFVSVHNLSDRLAIHEMSVPESGTEQPLQSLLHSQSVDLSRSARFTSSPSSYICLSYQWHRDTDSNTTEIIELNGNHFCVNSNLYSFLLEARRKLFSVLLWIDAICIDQSNVVERNSQVQIMGTIYEAATCVIIWLGSFALSISDIAWLRKHQRYLHADIEEALVILKAHNLEYWTRAWIKQEISLASNCLVWLDCVGTNRNGLLPNILFPRPLTLYRFQQLYRTFAQYSRAPSVDIRKVLDMHISVRTSRLYAQRLGPLLAIIGQHKTAKCTEPVDRIYALRSLCSDGNDIEVDYERSRWDLLCRVMWACRSNFCLCLVLHVMDALDLRRELETHSLSTGSINFASLVSDSRAEKPTRPFVSITTARPMTLIHGPGLPLAKSTIKDLDLVSLHFPKSRALRTCNCACAVSASWRSKKGFSLCLELLCQGQAFSRRHVFFENRHSLWQATGFTSLEYETYERDGFPGIFLSSRVGRGHRLFVNLTIPGLLQLISFLPKNAKSEHPGNKRRASSYEVMYEHIWDAASKPVGTQHAPPAQFNNQNVSINWLIEMLGVRVDRRPLFHIQYMSRPSAYSYGKKRISFPETTPRRHTVQQIHQPLSRSNRKGPAPRDR